MAKSSVKTVSMRNPTVPEPCDHVVQPDEWERGGVTSCGFCRQPVDLGPRELKYTGPPVCWNDGSTMMVLNGKWACQDPTCGVTGSVISACEVPLPQAW